MFRKTALSIFLLCSFPLMLSALEYWSPRFGMNGTSNNVPEALAVDSNSTLYIGGGFDYAFGVNTKFTARWNPITGWDSIPGLFAGSSFPIHSMVTGADNNIYVSGEFASIGSLTTKNVARWDGTKWNSVPGSDALGSYIYYLRIYYFNNKLYAVGAFTGGGGIKEHTGTAWQTVGTGIVEQNSNNSYHNRALAMHQNGTLYAATYSNATYSKETIAIVKWTGTAWDTVARGIAGGTGARVNDIALFGDTVYVVGYFTQAGNKNCNSVARWNGTSWDSMNTGTYSELYQVEVDSKGRVYVAGNSAPANGQSHGVLTRWNGTKWEKVGNGIMNPQFGQFASIKDMKIINNKLYLCGDFRDPGGISQTGVALYDIAAEKWLPLPGRNTNGTDWFVKALHEDNKGNLYISGGFTYAGHVPVYGLARWTGIRWDSIGGSGLKGGGSVKAIISDDTVTYFAGSFSSISGYTGAPGITKWNGTKFVSMAGTGQPGMYSSDIRAMVRYGTSIIVGGTFTGMLGKTYYSIAKWTGTGWDTLDAGVSIVGTTTSAGVINAMAVKGTDLYVAGQFNYAGTLQANNIARWDGTKWNTLGKGIYGLAANNAVLAMRFIGNDLYVVGKFDSAGTKKTGRIAKWNGTEWDTVSIINTNNYPITGIASDSKNRIYISGTFNAINSNSAMKYLARFTGTTWEAVTGGIDASTYNEGEMGVLTTDKSGNIWVSAGGLKKAGSIQAFGLAKLVLNPDAFDAVKKMDELQPAHFTLSQNYPNPFNPSTTIQFSIDQSSDVNLKIYDLIGREISTLVNEKLASGNYSVSWSGAQFSSGIYFYQLRAGTSIQTKRMLLVK